MQHKIASMPACFTAYLDNARQSCNVSQLLHGWQEATMTSTLAGVLKFLKYKLFQAVVHVKEPRDPHVGHEPLCNFVHRTILLLDELASLNKYQSWEPAVEFMVTQRRRPVQEMQCESFPVTHCMPGSRTSSYVRSMQSLRSRIQRLCNRDCRPPSKFH